MGNTRVSFARNSAGTSEILDTGNYYAFGLNHIGGNGLNSSGFGSWQSYKYNGKELQETGMYDYGARMYMSDLGRWGVIDPLAEKMTRYSPYNYAYNNPVSFIDPDGRKPQAPQDEIKATMTPTTMLMFYTSGGSGPQDLRDFLAQNEGTAMFQKLMKSMGLGEGGTNNNSRSGSNSSSTKNKEQSGENVDQKGVYRDLEEIVVKGKKGDWAYNRLMLQKALLAALEKRLDREQNFAYSTIGGFTSYIADSLDGFIGTTKEKFFSFSGGTNDPDPYTLDKLRPGDKIEANDMFEYILNGFNRSRTPKREDGLYQFAIDIQGIGNPFSRGIDSIALIEQVIKSPFTSPYDTIKMTIPANKYGDSVQFNEAVKKVNYSNDMKTYNRIHFLGRTNWK